ncbi:type I restriction endonuclease subunit R [Methanohalophilus mahii]|uniref:type I site-specific deoxyribonuclease n=1 Tax=Methanohalophilus mahii (strain ATCC 35705 / DSM 5219 / SLP) TaxID=547558 RepID=D5EBK9_METMS|nr:HsdR family type I site-specific deoxyribonuclease [Methanohalophilus mahii]ADE36560.1 type I site-specific deoxyribonuclease, HsdR family [Methanohalophilus mahii DSM 5219]
MFNEANSVENLVRDLVAEMRWDFVPADTLPREESEVLVEQYLVNSLVKLNPAIAEDPGRANEVLYKLRAIIQSSRGMGLVRANEEFAEWLRNEKTMPFGENGDHVSVKLIDYENIDNNDFIVTTQYTFKSGQERRPDLVLLVNGIPLVVGEAKTPVRPAISWVDGAIQLEEYQKSIPELFVPNVFCFATEGKTYRVGSIKLPIEKWQPWRNTKDDVFEQLEEVKNSIRRMLKPEIVLELLKDFTLYSTSKGGQQIKILCRYQQYEASKQIVKRVIDGRVKKGLIWHFQGSGKSLLMVYAAMQLRHNPHLRNPTVVVVVDRIDLNSQISATFNASNVPNVVIADSREELQTLLQQDTRKVIITTIHKFGEADGVLNERENIIVLVDEAHRTQEGDLGKKMRDGLPNAFLFGLTGTPINTRDRNTFWAFGAEEDENGYLNRYSFEQSVKDKATLPIYFEPRPVELHINKNIIDSSFDWMAQENKLEYGDKAELSDHAGKFGILTKAPDRISKVCQDIVSHYKKHVEPNDFKGQVVVWDREACHLYKQEIDKYMDPEESAVVMTLRKGDPKEWHEMYALTDDEQEKLLDRFRDVNDPLKLLIVTSKLLTGFDAPINEVMYLDKPMKDHTLLQAICRVNRPYPNKDHGLVVDYLGIFDNVAEALNFDVEEMQTVISNIDLLKQELPIAIERCLSHFPNVDREIDGYEGLLAAQDCLRTDEERDRFAADYSYLARHWEALSPDPFLNEYEDNYKWLTQVYESIKPPSGNGKLIWHALGGKTLKLIHENVTVQTIRDDLETLIMDASILEHLNEKDAKDKAKKLAVKIEWKLHVHVDDPRFQELGERLEKLKEMHYQNTINSIDFLKKLLEIARETVQLERETEAEPVDDTKESLTKLFLECKVETTPVIVEKIVNDIDNVVKYTRFDGWQWTTTGEREIQKALRQTLLKYKLHKEQELFDRAYEYIREHY